MSAPPDIAFDYDTRFVEVDLRGDLEQWSRAAAEVYRLAMARGMAEQDHTAIARIIEEAAGVSLRSEGGKA